MTDDLRLSPGLFRWPLGTRVEKRKGSAWHGKIVGGYSTGQTIEGYCVESEREPGSVQIYPATALREVAEQLQGANHDR